MNYYIDDCPAEPTGLTPEELKIEIKRQEKAHFGRIVTCWPEDEDEVYIIADRVIAWKIAGGIGVYELVRELEQKYPGIKIQIASVSGSTGECDEVETQVEFERAIRKIVNRGIKRNGARI